jgi:hypothetical protein
VAAGGHRLKFLESGSFRELPTPDDFDDGFIFLGSVIAMAA